MEETGFLEGLFQKASTTLVNVGVSYAETALSGPASAPAVTAKPAAAPPAPAPQTVQTAGNGDAQPGADIPWQWIGVAVAVLLVVILILKRR